MMLREDLGERFPGKKLYLKLANGGWMRLTSAEMGISWDSSYLAVFADRDGVRTFTIMCSEKTPPSSPEKAPELASSRQADRQTIYKYEGADDRTLPR
jgi:hypothetical protein